MIVCKTWEVTLAWRNLEDGKIGPEFTRTQIASTDDEAVLIVTAEIEAEQANHPDFWVLEPVNELQLRGVKERDYEHGALSDLHRRLGRS